MSTTWAIDATLSDDAIEYVTVFHPEILELRREREEAIAWRARAMQAQIGPGPVRVLTARPMPETVPATHCLSCDGPLDGPNRWRCRLCLEAIVRVFRGDQNRRDVS